jgi:hypothetical protein
MDSINNRLAIAGLLIATSIAGCVRHVGTFSALEDQMTSFTPRRTVLKAAALIGLTGLCEGCRNGWSSTTDSTVRRRRWRPYIATISRRPAILGLMGEF